MFKFKVITALMLCCVFESGLLKQIPDYINVCRRDPGTINECVRHSIEAIRPKLIAGIPELDVPGLDPLHIEEIVPVTRNNNFIRATGRNIVVSGTGNFTIKSLSVDLDNFKMRARVRFPKLHFEGSYKLDTQLLALPINGEGRLTADAVKCDAEVVLTADINEINNEEYIKFTKLDMDINIKDYKIQLECLFDGDKVLGETANQVINQNRGEFLRAAKPYVESTVSNLLLDFANRIVKDLTLNQLLPKP